MPYTIVEEPPAVTEAELDQLIDIRLEETPNYEIFELPQMVIPADNPQSATVVALREANQGYRDYLKRSQPNTRSNVSTITTENNELVSSGTKATFSITQSLRKAALEQHQHDQKEKERQVKEVNLQILGASTSTSSSSSSSSSSSTSSTQPVPNLPSGQGNPALSTVASATASLNFLL